jgi:hypothetical protein
MEKIPGFARVEADMSALAGGLAVEADRLMRGPGSQVG